MNTAVERRVVLHISAGNTALGLKKGQPSLFLEEGHSAKLLEGPTLFLSKHYCQSSARASEHTWAVGGYSMKSWLEFLYANEIEDWLDASTDDLISYRDAYLEAISPRTQREYSPTTVSGRMRVILDAYGFAGEAGWYRGDILDVLCDKTERRQMLATNDDAFVHLRRGQHRVRRNDLYPKVPESSTKIRPFHSAELRAALQCAGPRAAERAGDLTPSRDRLLFDFGWAVGLRVGEMARLKTLQFLALQPNEEQPWMEHAILVTGKGKKARHVAVPNWLICDVLAYIDGERKKCMSAGNQGRSATTQLFVAGMEANKPGVPLSVRRMEQIVSETCLAAGLYELVELTDPETGEVVQAKKSKHSIHDLRHTYAVVTYHAEVMNGNSEPWKKIQAQLGHKYLSTTMNTYLKYVNAFDGGRRTVDVRRLIGL